MRTSVLFFTLFAFINLYPQLKDSFSDGDFTSNPEWVGTVNNFRVNELFQLQSRAPGASTSFLFTPSEAVENAFWECHFIIDYPTSGSNFACMYIMSNIPSLDADIKAYYVMVGGIGDEVSLFYLDGTKRTKIIDGTDKRTDGRPVNIIVRVTRDSLGVFNLFSKLSSEKEFYFEGSVEHTMLAKSSYFGLSYTNTSTTGNAYCFDDVLVLGRPVTVVLPPGYDEGDIRQPDPGDIIFNEVMFHNPDTSAEYIELYNRSSELIDLSGMVITTRRQDGSLNTGHVIPAQTLLAPGEYLCLTNDPELIYTYHQLSESLKVIKTGWSALNNTTSTLVLLSSDRESVVDEFTYHVNMHHVLIKNAKGVALERIMPEGDTQDASNWHSASSGSGFGTPGYQNSQFRDLAEKVEMKQSFWLDKTHFSPDNHGDNDVCIIRYQLINSGYAATIQILNPNGVVVQRFPEVQIMATEGHFVWDGRLLTGKLTQQGIYVILIQIYHPTSGERSVYKLPVVVSSQ